MREITSSSARDYVNLIKLRGRAATHVAGTLYGQHDAPASSPSTTTSSTCRRRATCSWFATTTARHDRRVATILGIDHRINIDEMDLGRGPAGDVSLMLLATSTPVPPEVVAELRGTEGVVDARAIELD